MAGACRAGLWGTNTGWLRGEETAVHREGYFGTQFCCPCCSWVCGSYPSCSSVCGEEFGRLKTMPLLLALCHQFFVGIFVNFSASRFPPACYLRIYHFMHRYYQKIKSPKPYSKATLGGDCNSSAPYFTGCTNCSKGHQLLPADRGTLIYTG